MIALRAPRLFDGEAFHTDRLVLIENDEIVGLAAPGAVPANVDIQRLPDGALLAPGYIDLQVNGGGGIMFNDETTADGLARIAAAHARVGTTAILPTFISGTRPQLRAALAAARAAIAQAIPGIVGLHLEGPFLAPKRRGIHPASAMTLPNPQDMQMLAEPFPGPLLLTLAPERVCAADIAALARAGLIVFAGHTDATYEQAATGLEAGITGFTHLFNAMSPMESRAPGAVGAALRHRASYAGIIVDGHHVHPASVAIAHAAKGAGALFLVSDAMATAASDSTGFDLNGETIRLVDGRLTNQAGTLAGAHLTMAESVRNAVAMAGIPLADALRMATATPADVARLSRHGRIRPGAIADFLQLDAALNVAAVWQSGRRI